MYLSLPAQFLHFSHHVFPGGLERDWLDLLHRPDDAGVIRIRVRLRPLFRQFLRNNPVGRTRQAVFHGR